MAKLDNPGPKPVGSRRARSYFRLFNRFMLLLWRLGLGPFLNAWPAVGGRIMVLTHTGRRSGRRHQTPVNYAPIDEYVWCVAGFGPEADWYKNLLADPQVEVRLPRGRWSGVAEDRSEALDRLPRMRQVLIASGFAAYLAGLNLRRMSDAELERATSSYRLVRIRPT
jgi:deazaflavin-dependent oxidoreductase (nitroreductase family)